MTRRRERGWRGSSGPDPGARRSALGPALAVAGMLVACVPGPVPAPRPAPLPAPVPAPTPAPAVLPRAGTIAGGAGLLQYQVAGDGPDTAVVPLGSWLADSLAPLGSRHTLVFYDPRHRGRSHGLADSADATLDGDLADLDSVRAALHLTRFALVGFDYYAAVAAVYAAGHPGRVTRLALLSPIEPTDSLAAAYDPPGRLSRLDTADARALVKARAAGRDTTDPAGYCEAFWRVNAVLFVADSARAALVRPSWCMDPNETPARLAVAAGLATKSLGADVGARTAGLDIPVLVLQGRADLIANPDGAVAWARLVRDGRLLWLRSTGHLAFLEAAPQVRSALDFFLSGHWPPLAAPP